MISTYKEKDEHEMIVFRVPKQLRQMAQEKADKMMISKSAICRTALMEYLATDSDMFGQKLPQY